LPKIVGVKRTTFEKMFKILRDVEKIKQGQAGRLNKLSIENRLLMTLEYWREGGTYEHIAVHYGVSTSTASVNICWVEH